MRGYKDTGLLIRPLRGLIGSLIVNACVATTCYHRATFSSILGLELKVHWVAGKYIANITATLAAEYEDAVHVEGL
jgi:hypothetical protein